MCITRFIVITLFESQQLVKLDLNYVKYHQYLEFVMIKYRSSPALSSGSLTFLVVFALVPNTAAPIGGIFEIGTQSLH